MDRTHCRLKECRKEFRLRYPNQKYCCPAHGNRNRVRKHYKRNSERILAGKKADRA